MINESQFEEFTKALASQNMGDLARNLPGCLVIRGVGGAELITVLGLLPVGLVPDEILNENPSKNARAWSNYIMIFWKDSTTKARGRPAAAKVEEPVKE